MARIEILVAAFGPNLLQMQSMHRKEIQDRARPQLRQKYSDRYNSLLAIRFMNTTESMKATVTMVGTLRRRVR